MPSRVSLLANACLATVVVVALGIAFQPVKPPADSARLAAAQLSEPRGLDRPPVGIAGNGDGQPDPDDIAATDAGQGDDQSNAHAVPVPQAMAREVTIKRMSKKQLLKQARRKAEKAAEARVVPATDFVLSSFNVLGSSHTSGGGKNARMASGAARIRNAAALLNIHGVDVVGFQELQGDQYRSFLGAAGGAFDVYPGLAAGPLGIENSIAWRRSVWTLQHAATVEIPYFDGRLRPMPYVLLKHNETGRMAWFANFHNPASNAKRGNNDGHRAAAAAREVALANQLYNDSGYPVFITGDMNDRAAYFCRMTGGAPMVAANGGSNVGGACSPPSRMPVDWIFGHSMATFSNYIRDEGPLVRRTTDHPMIVATVTLDNQDGIPTAP